MKGLAITLLMLATLAGVGGAACDQTATVSRPATSLQTSAPTPATTAPPTRVQSGGPQTFSGEIMDSACAAKGSHDAMMKQEGAKDAKECTLSCVDHGSKFVLYDAATKTIYQLSDQSKAKDYAGQKVKVTGTPDRTTNTIDVENIDAAQPGSSSGGQ